jgi:tRNA A-37 threonylcarbamoyl transferase component Bud32
MSHRAREYQPGERVPGTVYQVVRVIGAGGMGTVYDVEDTTILKRYVLKTLHAQLGTRVDLARRMQNEARTLARLNHPNIVEIFTAGVTADELRLPYYVMERLNGQSLRLVLEKKGQLELSHAYHIVIDLLDALDHAHDKGVIHRDVKPDNIFLHRTTAAVTVTKLLDFGILSLLDGTSRETAGRFLGTLRYAAPEQLRGEKPTPKVDVYAVGLVLFEMIAGRGPFDDEGDPHKVAAAHMNKPPPPLSTFLPVPPELDSLVDAALAKSPAHRPRDAFSFAASLRNLKKALAGVRGHDTTEDRATAAAVVGVESAAAPFVHVRQPSPDGPYVISPAPPDTPLVTPPAGAVRTTMAGMAPPSPAVAGPAAPASFAPTATSAPSVDRAAATNSVAGVAPWGAPQPESGGAGSGGAATISAFAPTLVSDAPPPASVSPFQWPAERPMARSEEPQVRTLSGGPTGRRQGALVVSAVLLMMAMALVAVGLLVVKARVGSRREGRTAGPTASGSSERALPIATLSAPTNAPPAVETTAPLPVAVPSPSAAPALLPAARVTATGHGTARPATGAVAPPSQSVTTAATPTGNPALPGPGF